MRDGFAFTSGFPLAKAGDKTGADRLEEYRSAVMGPQQAGADQRDRNQRGGDE